MRAVPSPCTNFAKGKVLSARLPLEVLHGKGVRDMASVNYTKVKGASAAKAMLRHCDAVEREDTGTHSNADIDRRLTGKNLSMEGLSYGQACMLYDGRLAELDARPGANVRKDRVTLLGLSIPRPAELPEIMQVGWFSSVYELISEQYGRENVIEGYVHMDEVHDYIDPGTGQTVTSREHMHVYVVPERGGKLNAKACSARSEMIKLNTAIEKMTAQEFGCHFMTGTGKKGESVEDCKAASREAELVRRERRAKLVDKSLRERAGHLDKQEAELEKSREDIQAKEKALAAQEKELAAKAAKLQAGEDVLAKRIQQEKLREQKAADFIRLGREAAGRRVSLSVTGSTGLNHPERGNEYS